VSEIGMVKVRAEPRKVANGRTELLFDDLVAVYLSSSVVTPVCYRCELHECLRNERIHHVPSQSGRRHPRKPN
jgi:hypothetical protein